MKEEIYVKGAKENNLKNVDVRIPRNTLTVFTGLSGSGKSTLAFDTIFAEGQRRYIESLSSYARHNFFRSSDIVSRISIALSKSSCAEATFISAFNFSISAGISASLTSSPTFFLPVIPIEFFTSLIMVLGTMPCAALYSDCILRRRLVSSIARFMLPVDKANG